MTGFIALHREAFSHPLLKDAERFRAWFWLVANAAWKPTKHDARGRTITVERGQICAGREYLAKEWGWSPSAVERFLSRLETEQMIERTTGQIKTVITICNYDRYQDAPSEAEHMSGQQSEQKPDRNRTTKEQGNKETREPNGSHTPHSPPVDFRDDVVVQMPARSKRAPAAPRPFAMPADWQPGPMPETVQALVALWPPGRLDREVEQFRDYWLDRTEKRPGWDRTFHNRIRDIHDRVLRENRDDRRSHQPAPARPSRHEGDGFTRALDRLDAGLAERRGGFSGGATGTNW